MSIYENHDEDFETVYRFERALYGFDTSRMTYQQAKEAIAKAEHRAELIEAKERIVNPQKFESVPLSELSEPEKRKRRKIDLLEAKLSKVTGDKDLKEKDNETLKFEIRLLKEIEKISHE